VHKVISTGFNFLSQIKGTWSKKRDPIVKNPFDQGGPMQNCCYTLCAPLPPSLIDRRGFVPADFVSTDETAQKNGRKYGATGPVGVFVQLV